MGTSLHERVLRSHADQDFKKDPMFVTVAAQYLERMYEGVYDHLDAVTQTWLGRFDIYDAYAFMRMHAMLCQGDIVMAKLEVGKEPKADTEVDYHNEILSDLRAPFSGEFWGGLADRDGKLSWNSPIRLTQFPFDTLPEHHLVEVPVRSISLEVGYTRASRTLLHLREDGALARWPHGSTFITIFVSIAPYGVRGGIIPKFTRVDP